METRLFIFLLRPTVLAALGLAVAAPAFAADATETAPDEQASQQQRVIEPEIERRDIERPRIDTEDFEVGAYGGIMSVEDFGTNSVVGVRFAYHITESFQLEATYGRTDTEKTSFELLSGGAQLLEDDERTLTYYDLTFGWNILPGEAFFGRKHAWNTALYLVGGAGSTQFAGDDHFTAVAGMGFRMLPNDWLAVHADVRDHLFDSDLLGEKKTTHNIEAVVGLTIFF
jgi:outer membrane beta-barrel protein